MGAASSDADAAGATAVTEVEARPHSGRGRAACGDAAAPRWGRWLLAFGLPFLFLNALLTFENAGQGAGVRFGPRLSFELCMGTVALMAWMATGRRVGERALVSLATLYVMLVVTRYVDVTVPALFGRPVNLYWDGPHLAEVLRLAASSSPGWAVAAWSLGLAMALAVLFLAVRAAMRLLAASLVWHRPRRWLLGAGAGLAVSFAVHPVAERDTRWFFAMPVSPAIARQAALLPAAWSADAGARLSPSPRFDGNVSALRGADVLLVFAESYGMTTFDDPRKAQALAPARQRLQQAIATAGRQVVSARVASPTFGGSSWLAHAALLSGVDTRRPQDHDLLLTTDRPTLVRHFADHGYRTVGWMPGLQRPWPEGAFYGFDRYAGLDDIGYKGPAFGYWKVPDQASLALLLAQELADVSRPPRFIVFPTVTSHAPFRPVAPYRDNWQRLRTTDAYSGDEVRHALGEPVSWLQPVPAYLQSMDYLHEWLAGFVDRLDRPAPRGLLTIVIGDHQPLASASGQGASWDVPVHVISDDTALLGRFKAAGFTPGLQPAPRSIDSMHRLTGVLLALFDRQEGAVRAVAAASAVR